MNATLVILLSIVVVFLGVIALGRYAEGRQRKGTLDRLFNVPCPGCGMPLGDRHAQIVGKISMREAVSHAHGRPFEAFRVRCGRCGHVWVCDDDDRSRRGG